MKTDLENVEENRKRAAYALNMCTVSVSQIIDYNDLNVLEQEYEAILNNIDLEQMPKDNVLLQILKRLLDTITYFRLEEGDRAIIEKEYQNKMKNAIWAAAPNFGLIVAGGNPLTMAISLASQVGIGYMNYRRNKAEYELEKEKQSWQLQRAAMEQFNGLRRELFDTAWHLAASYNFPDKYRLTENQIKQYNTILMDKDELRKYERLESIKDSFEAYPPFWYFIGSTANYIAGNNRMALSDNVREKFRKKAREYFEKNIELNKMSILREDRLIASCALEYSDILLLEQDPDILKISELLHQAIEKSGRANDVMQICAVTYLRIGDFDNAANILKILVNESYNTVVNAQLLSSIYVHDRNQPAYEMLATRVDVKYLYPMPKASLSEIPALDEEFKRKQKRVLKEKYKITVTNMIGKYAVKWNQITSIFEWGYAYPEELFLDNPGAKEKRMTYARRFFSDPRKVVTYQERMRTVNYGWNMQNILNEFCRELFALDDTRNPTLQEKILQNIREKIIANSADINQIQGCMTEGTFDLQNYKMTQDISFKSLVLKSANEMLAYIDKQIDHLDLNQIAYMEGNLRSFCIKYEINEPEIEINRRNDVETHFSETQEYFPPELFGAQAVIAKKNIEFMQAILQFLQEKVSLPEFRNANMDVYFMNEDMFNGYFYDEKFREYPEFKIHAIMVLKDKTRKGIDLIFTTDGLVHVVKGYVKNLTPYHEAKIKDDTILLYEDNLTASREYKNPALDINGLYNIIHELGTKFDRTVDSIVREIDFIAEVTASKLNQWFLEQNGAMSANVDRIYELPTRETLEKFGYKSSSQINPQKAILQYYSDKYTNALLGVRVVKFNNIESNFHALLLDNGGTIKVKTK